MAALTKIIPSYLYVQYNDDPALQALVKAFNVIAQNYLDTLNDLNLYDYTKDPVSGDLLDWVALGFFGFRRPVLPVTPVDDDLFRRVITWHFYKGDGLVFDIRWLKRRIMRFLYGADGIDPGISTTYRISVVQDDTGAVAIRVLDNIVTVTGGALYEDCLFNDVPYNDMQFVNVIYPPIAEASLLQQAMQSGILELPFQFTFTVTEGGFAVIGV